MTNFAKLAAAAVESGKVAEADFEGGGSSYTPPAEGPAICRLVSVVDLGVHDQRPYKGQPKPPAAEMLFEFQLFGKKHKQVITVDGEEVVKYPTVRAVVTKKSGRKSAYIKLLEAMRGDRKEIVHPAMLLGESFLIKIIHNDNGKTGAERRVYANIKDASGNWTVSPAVRINDEGEAQAIAAPEATVNLRCLLWEAPDMDQWNSLYIKGSRKGKDGENVSNNWIQDKIAEANDFQGSAVQVMLFQDAGMIPGKPEEAPEVPEEPEDTEEEKEEEELPEMGDDDLLDELGL